MIRWNSRSFTPFGRLTVIKTLLIPKINHLILALPNPSEEVIKSFQNDLYNFLWKSKIHKVNKSVIIQDYRKGVLKWLIIKKMITALKSSWIRRILQSNATTF